MQRDVLGEWTLRKYNVNDLYNEIMDKIRVQEKKNVVIN
jgi:hypothetical protein